LSRRLENPLTFCSLYDSPLIQVRDYRCCACRGGPAAEEQADSHDIVLLRRGVFGKHVGRQSLIADVNQAVFFTKGSTYRVSHPSDCGDRGTVFTLALQALNDVLRGSIPPPRTGPTSRFRSSAVPAMRAYSGAIENSSGGWKPPTTNRSNQCGPR